MKRVAFIVPVALLFITAALPLHAQLNGCTDSPENPTAVLGLLVSAASIGFVQIRNRFRIGENK